MHSRYPVYAVLTLLCTFLDFYVEGFINDENNPFFACKWVGLGSKRDENARCQGT